jgi:ribonuclease E
MAEDAPVAVEATPVAMAPLAASEPVMAQAIPLEHAAEEILPDAPPAPTPEPAPEPAPEPVSAVETQPALPPVKAEPVAGPISAPVIIGADSATGERKRGWWKR